MALRLWAPIWQPRKCILSVKSDNIAALIAVRDLKGSSGGLRTIAQEMALDFAFAAFEPDAVCHTPGIQNPIADALSRKRDPSKAATWQLPAALAPVTQSSPPRRDRKWWRSVDPPSAEVLALQADGTLEDLFKRVAS